MHGLLNRSVEEYLRARYGEQLWRHAARAASVDERGFLAIRDYPDSITVLMVDAAAQQLGIGSLDLFEDMGAWLGQVEPLRRLLRFSGSDYADFVLALEQLPARGHMIVPGLHIPLICVSRDGPERFQIAMKTAASAWVHVVAGLLRQMADDFGVLALIAVNRGKIDLTVPEYRFAEGRPFTLVTPVARALG